jgi:NAD(P)-dependent dehydrogenase (short-subunit alcohol dehydrogenase family)
MSHTKGAEPVTALVTGANSGIGSAIVGALLERGASVVATVRSDAAEAAVRKEHSDRNATSLLTVERLDLADADAAARVIATHRPDVLINNAGHARLGGIMDIADEDASAQLDALVIGPARLSRLLVEQLRADRRTGRIVNISSMLASADLPFTGWYSAAKAAFDVVGDALALELRPSGVEVVRIECGAVRTGAWDDAGDDVLGGDDATTAAARRRWVDLTTLAQPLFADPSAVGKVVAEAATAARPRAAYRVGFASRFGIVADLIPAPVERAVTARLFGLTRGGPAAGLPRR